MKRRYEERELHRERGNELPDDFADFLRGYWVPNRALPLGNHMKRAGCRAIVNRSNYHRMLLSGHPLADLVATYRATYRATSGVVQSGIARVVKDSATRRGRRREEYSCMGMSKVNIADPADSSVAAVPSCPAGTPADNIPAGAPAPAPLHRKPITVQTPFFFWGVWAVLIGMGIYFGAILISIVRLLLLHRDLFVPTIAHLLWISGFPTTVGLGLIAIDLGLCLPLKRRHTRKALPAVPDGRCVTVALTAYNDELSIAEAVRDFSAHPRVSRVIVVSNNSQDGTIKRALEAGAVVLNEERQGYGNCVYRCLFEAALWQDTDLVVLCEGDMSFRAADLDKFLAYAPHAQIINGTRIVEQLREYRTQLSTFMYYGNFFAGKLLEAKYFGKGTFTDVGTTYKMLRRETVAEILPLLDPAVNLEFNAHFLDQALRHDFSIVECPITFHPRIGQSKGGNTNNFRALKVGLRMIWGLTFGWGWLR